jgi:hypothetical protein
MQTSRALLFLTLIVILAFAGCHHFGGVWAHLDSLTTPPEKDPTIPYSER